MKVVRQSIQKSSKALEEVPIYADRHQLAKRRWRGVAEDGMEIGFELEEPLRHGACVLEERGKRYIIAQLPETVLEFAVPADPAEALRIGWLLGNGHVPIQLREGYVRTPQDLVVKATLEAQGMRVVEREAVFEPERAAVSHFHRTNG